MVDDTTFLFSKKYIGNESRVFNFGNKKISEPTEKREIPEISAQIQIELKNFKKFWHDFNGDRGSSNLPRRHGVRLQPAGRRRGGRSWAARGARGQELEARAAAG
jgi:hypothetical protein